MSEGLSRVNRQACAPEHSGGTPLGRALHMAASIALSYPETPVGWRGIFPRLESYWDREPLSTVQADYVETFDMRKRCCLYLTYYTHGDTRRRGLALLKFRQAYRAAGLEVTDEELPDHLAVVLEFSATGNDDAARELLVAHRAGLDLLWQALDGLGSPYADVIAAVRATLPPPGPADIAAARALAQEGPALEMVGI